MAEEIWTVGRILSWIEGFLAEHGDAGAKRSARWLVAEALAVSPIQLYADLERPLSGEERTVLRDYTRRRAAGEPLQYITGTTDFRFITVKVRKGVLIPRPETEVLVSEALAELKPRLRAMRDAVETERLRSLAAASGAGAEGLDGSSELGAAVAAEGGSDAGAAFTRVADGGHGYENGRGAGSGAGPHSHAAGNEATISFGVDGIPGDAPADAVEDGADGNGAPVPDAAESAGGDGAVSRSEIRVVDACTGTGCVACAIASEVPEARVIATDIAPEATALARENASDLGLSDRVSVVEGDLLSGLPADWAGRTDLVISNPPYIPTRVLGRMDAEVVDFEPRLALDGGGDGLDLYRRLLPQAFGLLSAQGVLAVELHETRLDEAARLAQAAGFAQVRVACDLAGRQRVLVARKIGKE
jgi:release factor glutamine methyltransferase